MDRTKGFAGNALTLALAGFCSSAYCSLDALTDRNVIALNESPLSLETLDRQRGGFIDANGLKIQIGLEKVVLVDGVVAARSRLVIPDMNLRSKMESSMAAAKGNMADSKAAMQETFSDNRKTLDQQMAQSFDAVNQVIGQAAETDTLGDKSLTANDAVAVNAFSESLKSVQKQLQKLPGAQRSSSGASLDVKSNAQAGVNTETATLSLANANQVSVHQPMVVSTPASSETQLTQPAAESVSQLPIQSSLQPSMLVDQALTRVTEVGNTTLIQNSANNRLIQTVQVLNIELSNLSQLRGQRIQARMLPQMIQYSR
ncbi:hypothetical protein KOI40_04025 [Aestuariicella sp. G3-2]|uniref:hypothetical protein n=1 Tax=Pseudomaricurvus albidus TaxID=2842452 RepID=UPI001C0BEB9E|nr:hypothetical protein [Aestuariicella albida]MBU3068973.1 hypothetical protein [Aestuariicella albida]